MTLTVLLLDWGKVAVEAQGSVIIRNPIPDLSIGALTAGRTAAPAACPVICSEVVVAVGP
jgi:hypothetical protein